MRILANENFPLDAVEALRQQSHDVAWVRADAPGSSDQAVLQRAQSEDRIVVTFDKDFGELAFRARLSASSGSILFRISTASPEHVACTAVAALSSRTEWAGNFSVVEDRRIRVTPLPK
jgi:predicted nuclease of predicted toxin-antitoxin system